MNLMIFFNPYSMKWELGAFCLLTGSYKTESEIDKKKLTLKYVASTLRVVASGPVDNSS